MFPFPFFLCRLRHLWNRKTNETIDGFDFTSDEGITHIEGEEAPIPLSNKEILSRASTRGGESAAAAAPAVPAAVAAAHAPRGRSRGRGRGGRGGSVAYADRYGKESLGGSQYWGGSNLNSDVYERRLLGVSALSVAWSPTVVSQLSSSSTDSGVAPNLENSATTAFSIIAIGTKEGRIWLWRCVHPALPALPGSEEQERSSLDQRLSLVGRLPGNLSWAGVMKWISIPITTLANNNNSNNAAPLKGPGGASSSSSTLSSVLVLAVGSSDGRVTLWGADSSTLGHAESLETPLTKWATICAPDLVQVTSLDARFRYSSSPNKGPQLVIAVGKSAGGLCAWVSQELPVSETPFPTLSSATDKIRSALRGGEILQLLDHSVLSSQSVSGVTLAAGAELLVACCRDGRMETWALPKVGNTLQPSVAPVPCARRKQKDMGFGAFGVAASPGGTFVAVARCSLPAGVDFVK